MTPDPAASWQVIQHHSKSFALAARLLPRAARQDAAAVYAWCRACDDAIDLDSGSDRSATLAALHAELDAIYRGEAQSQLGAAAFQVVVQRRGIPIQYPRELLAGLQMDVDQQTYVNTHELLGYGFRVAGTVGLMMCHVLGVSDARALSHAAHLGIAMQLTNICRDVAEDWQRGRLYVPRDLLGDKLFDLLAARLGREPLTADLAAQLAMPVRRLLALADEYYHSGDRGLAYLSSRAAFSIRTARLVYAAIGGVIACRGHDVLAGRATLSGRSKAGLALRAAGQTLKDFPSRWLRSQRHAPPDGSLRLSDALRLPVDATDWRRA